MSTHNSIPTPLMSDGERTIPRHVLLITPHYAPDYGPSAPIFTWLCEDLIKMGFRVSVICGVPHYGQAAELARYFPRKVNYEYRSGVDLYRIRVLNGSKNSLVRRILYHVLFNVNVTQTSLKLKKTDVIIGNGPVLWSGIPLLVKAIFPRTPFIYTVFDVYPDVLEKLGVVKAHWIANLIRKIESIYYRKSSSIVVLSQGFKDNLVSNGVEEQKIHVIPPCVDVDFFQPLDGNHHLRRKWNLEDQFVVLYSGNVGYSQGLDTVLDAACILTEMRSIKFVIVGDGVQLENLKNQAKCKDISNIQFHEFVPFEEVPHLYSIADACLVSMKPELVIESVPSKTYSIMACGKPVLATVDSNSEVSSLLNIAKCGICVPPGNPEALAAAVMQLYSDREGCATMGKNGRNYAVMNFQRKVAAIRYSDLIELCNS